MTAHTPMTSNGPVVFLPDGVSFSVSGLPDSTGLASMIARACTTHLQLVQALRACLTVMDSDLPPCATEDERANARAALVDAGVLL